MWFKTKFLMGSPLSVLGGRWPFQTNKQNVQSLTIENLQDPLHGTKGTFHTTVLSCETTTYSCPPEMTQLLLRAFK